VSIPFIPHVFPDIHWILWCLLSVEDSLIHGILVNCEAPVDWMTLVKLQYTANYRSRVNCKISFQLQISPIRVQLERNNDRRWLAAELSKAHEQLLISLTETAIIDRVPSG
jgi:hypothetical protein